MIGHAKLFKKSADGRSFKSLKTQIYRDAHQLIAQLAVLAVEKKCIEQKDRILAARKPNGDPIPILYHCKFVARPAQTSQYLFHGISFRYSKPF